MRYGPTVAAFAILNLVAWAAWWHWGTPREGVLAVESWPGDDQGEIADRSTLAWRFNLPMRQVPGAQPAGFTPAVAGTFRWEDERTLVFTARRELPPATAFVATLSSRQLASSAGFRLGGDISRSLHTPPLRLMDVAVVGHEGDGTQVLALAFSDRVLPSELLAHLTVTDAGGREVPCAAHGEPEAAPVQGTAEAAPAAPGTFAPWHPQRSVVRVAVGPVPMAPRDGEEGQVRIRLHLAAGLAGTSGPLGLRQDLEREVVLGRRLRLDSLGAECPARGQVSLTLHFSGAVATEVIQRAVRVAPPVPFTVVPNWNGVSLEGDFQPGTRYAVTVLPPPPGAPADGWPWPDTLGIEVGDRQPGCWFAVPGGYLGSTGRRTVLAHAINLSEVTVTVTRLVSEQVVAWRASGNLEAFSQVLAERTLAVEAGNNLVHDLPLALDELLPAGCRGDGVYGISIASRTERITVRHEQRWWYRLSDRTVVSLSDLALQARTGADAVQAWVLSLGSAAPRSGVQVRLFSERGQALGEAVTGAEGLARIALPVLAKGDRPGFLVAQGVPATPRDAPDLTWLDLHGAGLRDDSLDTGGRPYLRHGHEAFLFSDRGVYRPGETVHLRALVRDPGGAVPAPFPVRLRVLRPDLRLWRNDTAILDGDGDATWDLDLPTDLPTGRWTVDCGLPGDERPFGSMLIQVEDFLPDRLRALLAISGPGLAPLATGEDDRRYAAASGPLAMDLQGDWLFGQPAADQPCRLDLRLDPQPFAHREWSGWTFADQAGAGEALGEGTVGGRRLEARTSTLDAKGHAAWSVDLAADLAAMKAVMPWRLSAAAGVREASGRTTTSTRRLVVDPVDRYLGLRLAGAVSAGAASPVELRLVAPDGTAFVGEDEVELRLYRESWETSVVEEGRQWRWDSHRRLTAVGEPVAVRLASGACRHELTLPGAGAWVVVARDRATGQRCSLSLWASGDGWRDGISRERPERCLLAVVKDERSDPSQTLVAPAPGAAPPRWQVGERLALVVRSPFPGRLLVTVATDRLLETRVLVMDAPTAVVPLTIAAAWTPNAWVSATVVRGVDAQLPWRVHRAYGVALVEVDEPARRALVEVGAPAQALPGEAVAVAVAVRGADGSPLADAAVALAAVDEGVLRLTAFRTPDPSAYFTGRRGLEVAASDCYGELMPEVERPAGASPIGGDGAVMPSHRPPLAARRVKPLALWAGALRTGADGVAHATFTMPATFAGQVRLMAVADRGPASGSSSAGLVVRGPLVLQSSWPRCAAPGDRFIVPVMLSAQGVSGPVRLMVQGAGGDGPLQVVPEASDLVLGADGRGGAEFAVTVREATGVARLRLVASAQGAEAVEELELPVRPASPVMREGDELAAGPDQPLRIALPGALLAGPERMTRIHVGPLPTLNLPAGLDALYRYPYGCAEQTVSAVFPLVALPDLAARLGPDRFPAAGLAERIRSGVLRLQGMETAEGGVAMWQGGHAPWPWASVYAAHFLIELKAAGGTPPEDFLTRLLGYVRRLAGRGREEEAETAAYACYVLARAGRPETVAMNRLAERLGNEHGASPWLAAAWACAGRRDLASGLLPQRLPEPRAERRLADDLASPVRDRAVQVLALLDAAPSHPALPRLVQSLADRSSWCSTQDTAFAVIALGRWLRAQPRAAAGAQAIELRLDGRTVARAAAGAELDWSGDAGTAAEVVVSGGADCRAWVAWQQSGIPLRPPADEDHGLSVRRTWIDDHGAPVEGRPLAVGELVQVRLEVSSAVARELVVVEDILPAGCEIENPRLVTSGDGENQGESQRAMDVRDDRIIIVGRVQGPGAPRLAPAPVRAPAAHRLLHTYLLRAVTAGTFVRPPVRAACMYDSGVNSISGAGTMVVEAHRP